MTIQEIKLEVAAKQNTTILKLIMVDQYEEGDGTLDTNGKPVKGAKTPWVSHWDDAARFRVVMHEDLMSEIETNPTMDGLAYKTQQEAEVTKMVAGVSKVRAAYIRYVVIKPEGIRAQF